MNIDLTAIAAWVQTGSNLGFIVGAVALGILAYQKMGPKPLPILPTPEASAATVAPVLAGTTPLIDLLLKTVGKAPSGRPATVDDVPHWLHVQLKSEVATLDARKVAAANAVIGHLAPPDPAKD